MKKKIFSVLSVILALTVVFSAMMTVSAADELLAPVFSGIRSEGSSVMLEWYDENEEVSAFYVYRSETGKKGTWTRIASTSEPSYVDSTAIPGKTYYYTLKSVLKVNGKTIASASCPKEMIELIWERPVFTLTGNSGKGVLLQWDGTGTDGVIIYRSATGKAGTWTKIKTIKGNKTTSYTDTKVVIGETYYYCFKEYKTIGGKNYYSQSSKAYKKVISDVAVPENLSVTAKSSCNEFSYDKVPGTRGYVIYRSFTGKKGSWTKVSVTTSNNKLTYVDKDIITGKEYYYTVKSYKTLDGKNYYSASAPAVSTTSKKGEMTINVSSSEIIFSELLEKQNIRINVDGAPKYGTIQYEIGDTGIISCQWGKWNGDTIDLTVTRIGHGETTLKIFYEDYPESAVVLNVSAAKLELDDDYAEASELIEEAYGIFSEALSLLSKAQGKDISEVEKAQLVSEAIDKVGEVTVILEEAKILAEKYASIDGTDAKLIDNLLKISGLIEDFVNVDSLNSPLVAPILSSLESILKAAGII